MKLVGIAALAAPLAALVAFLGAGRPEAARGVSAPPARAITVSGTGTVVTVPDRAEFSFGVTTQARTASQALAGNAAEMRKVIAAVKAAGVAARDIRTELVSLSPRYSQDGEEILGYTASNSVSARIRDLERAGTVIDAAVAAGANQVSGPALTRSDAGALYRTALRAAVANARLKARAVAAGGQVRLGRIRSAVESGATPPPVPTQGRAEAPQTPIEPGTQLVQATVTVEFAIG